MLLLNNAQILSLQLQQLGGLLDLLTAIGFHQPPPPASSAAALQFSSIVKMELVEARLSSSEYASAAISPCQGGWNTSGDAAGRPLPPNSPPSPFLLYSHRLVSQENVNCITFSLLYTLLPDLIAHMPEMKAFVLPVHVKFKLQTVHSNFLDARAQIVLSIVRYWRSKKKEQERKGEERK